MSLLSIAALQIFDLEAGLSFWTLVVFLVLLAVLYKWAYPPILGAVEERERNIQEVLDAAARDRAQAEKLLAEREAQLAESRQRAQEILQEGKQAAERVRQEIMQQAREQQDELLERARKEIAVEREAALDALRKEAVEVSIAVASKLVGQRLDAEEDRRIAREYLARVGEANGGAGAA